MLMDDSNMIIGLLVLCSVLHAVAVGGIMVLLWCVFSRVILRDTPDSEHIEAPTQARIEEEMAAAYRPVDPWDELRIDRDDIAGAIQTLPEEEGYKS